MHDYWIAPVKVVISRSLSQENEKTRDIIIEQRFHGTIIGARGENIRDIREKFNQVQITFPDPGKKSDIVTLRGPKNDVDRCYKHLQGVQKDMVSSLSYSCTMQELDGPIVNQGLCQISLVPS